MKKGLTVLSVLLVTGFCLFSFSAFAQQKEEVSGKVVDAASGDPLPAATITTNAGTGAISGGEGEFTLSVSQGDTIKVSVLGYELQKMVYSGQDSLIIKMGQGTHLLSQLVVVGYGTQKRSDLTGSVAELNNKVIEHASTSNVGIALQGQLPGLKVTQSTGQPGTSPSMVFRGGTTFGGAGTPLFVIDGVVVSSLYGFNMDDIESITVLKDAASTAIYGARASNGVILIKTKKGEKGHTKVTYTIREKIDFVPKNPLKYLNAQQYIHWNRYALGNRWAADMADGNTNAANNDMNQNLGAWGWAVNNGWTSPIGLYSTQLVTNANRHLIGAKGWNLMTDPNPFTAGQTDSILFRNSSVQERQNMIFHRQNTQDHHLSFSGGSDLGDFDLGLGLTKDNGVIIGSSMDRISMNFNGGLNIGKRLKINTTMSAYNVKLDLPYVNPENNLIQRFIGVAPTVRYTNDTSGAILPGPNDISLGNPEYWKDKFNNRTVQQRFMGGLHLTYTILPGLDFLASGSGFVLNTTNDYFTKAYQRGNGGSMNTDRPASYDVTQERQFSYNAFLQYSKTFGDHDLSVMGGGEFLEYRKYLYTGSASGAPTDFIPWLSASLPVSISNGSLFHPQSAYSGFDSWDRLASIIGRINYNYKDKYLLTANFRYDGTSRLAANKYGFFPGISVGWNMQKEDFFQESSLSRIVSVLKPRISYGVNGNLTSIGTYATAQVYSSAGIYDGQGATYYPGYINPDLKWESSATTNFGVDLGLLNGRIYVTADYFIRNVYNKIASQPIAVSTGFTSFTTNLGQLRNQGLELEATARIIQPVEPDGFSWQMSANFASVKSYAVTLPDNGLPGNRQQTMQVYDSKGNILYVGGLTEGKRIGLDEVWAPSMDGIYRSQDQIDKDANVYNSFLPYSNRYLKTLGDARWHQTYHNDTINSRQFVYVGRTTPDITGGFSTTLSWKGFSLYAQFDYALDFIILNNAKMRGLSLVQGSQNSPVTILDTWTPDNPDAPLPKVYWANQGRNYATDAAGSNPFAQFWEKGDYLAIRNVSLSYEMSNKLLEQVFKNRVKGLQLSISGTNLYYFSAYDGFNKETGGVDWGAYPLPIGLTFGATVSF